MKLSEAENLALALENMMNAKGIVGYKIARNLRMINDELKEYYELKQELFRKYGTQDGDRIVIPKDSEGYPLFMEEIAPFEGQEVEFDFRMIKESELMESDLTAQQMYVLNEYMVEE